MIKYIFTLPFLLFTMYSFAQNAEGCDGTRYIEDSFTELSITENIQFGESTDVAGTTRPLEMDIYEPSNDTQEKRPLIILAHGGSFITGIRQDMADFCAYYARKGYVAATIDYRLWNLTAGFPDSLGILEVVVHSVHDMKAAVRFFRQDADTENTYRIDPDNIIVGGLSAGGVMALHVGMMEESDDIPEFVLDIIEANGGIEGTSGNEGYSSEVQAIINMSGGLYQKEWIDADDPPFLSMHGTADGTVPYGFGIANNIMSINGSGNLHPVGDEVGVENYLISVPDGGHVDIYFDEAYISYRDELDAAGMQFIASIICENTSSISSSPDAKVELSVYPNPSSSTISIEVNSSNSEYDIQVLNQLGQLVQRMNQNTSHQYTLRQDQLGNGLFFVRIETPFGIKTKKVLFID